MKRAVFYIWLSIVLAWLAKANYVQAETSAAANLEIGVDEHLGQYVPLDLKFIDENGDTVTLQQLISKPTILTLVYYNCPGLCSPLLSGVVEVLDKMNLKPGIDYQVLTISFNPRETVALAREKKRNYFAAFRKKKNFPPDAWHWMVGDSANIARLTKAVGFRYKKSKDGFLHPALITVLSEKGKIARYLYGITYLPFDLQMAIVEASQGRVGPTIAKVLRLCFNYDPKGRKYVFNFLRVAGALVIFSVIVFVVVISVKKKFS